MLGGVVPKAPGHDRHIGLRLGFVVEGHRALHADLPTRAEGPPERLFHRPDGGEVCTALGFRDDELTADQLDGVAG